MTETTDVWFIAFLINSGYKIESYVIIDRGKVKCKFNVSNDLWRDLKLSFHNSELLKYKQIISSIKDLSF